jgi:hypothetical protein
MLLKIGKMTPQCPKWLPSDEYTDESWLPGGEYTGEFCLPWDEYTGESTSKCFELALEQLYKKLTGE